MISKQLQRKYKEGIKYCVDWVDECTDFQKAELYRRYRVNVDCPLEVNCECDKCDGEDGCAMSEKNFFNKPI